MTDYTLEDANIDADKIVRYWLDSSEEDFSTMLNLFNSKSFTWSLFLGHLCIEKLLKASYVKSNRKHAPFIHNLYRLSELAGMNASEEYLEYLDKITTFNINARYDDYKREFSRLCTPEFTSEWIEKIGKLRAWIKTQL